MACPTCDHTMQGMGMQEIGQRVFWCPRCGTLRYVAADGSPEHDMPPKLPLRLRHSLTNASGGALQKSAAWAAGLYEACMVKPECWMTQNELL